MKKKRESLTKNDIKYSEEYKGEYKVTARLSRANTVLTRERNIVKIVNELRKERITPKQIRQMGYNSVELIFNNREEANNCIIRDRETDSNGEIKRIEFYKTERNKIYKGVIKDWDRSMTRMELVDAIDDKSRIISMERISRRYYDREEKTTKKKYRDDILIIILEEEQITKEIKIYKNITSLKIRPYVEPVNQCFNCFKYGHVKSMRKSERRCIICATKEHSRCQRKENCINCGENHRSTSKQCKVFQYDRKITVTRIREATKKIDEEERTSGRGWEITRDIIRI